MMITLPIFPLSTHILPGGRLPLTIFEPRYLSMITQCCRNKEPFGIVCIQPQISHAESQLMPIGTGVTIVDFDLLQGGILGVIVEGQFRFRMRNPQLSTETTCHHADQATVQKLSTWPVITLPESEHYIADCLSQIYIQYPELGKLYQNPQLKNLTWLCQRWLEVLPLSIHEKQAIMAAPNCERIHQLLIEMLKGS
ncbi:LON peptidase substrate-binding domain-containing protein [Celerinatantimonas sp. YJH-8]|uniref:LON peptidase substrate-binding domain-containing protein n=1 Tax=Celerinatantimonas sp. YJH-8 TaxID=3228714 RepID=UPI0038C26B1C